jgi:3-hydroxyisobutyrate dehydrogenase
MARIAFLGLGRMGLPMATRLIDAGHDLSVYNRTAAKAAPLVELGAELATTPKAAVREVEAIVAMVGDDVASKQLWQGRDGALAGRPAPAALAIECSTLSAGWVHRLAEKAAERGLRYVDAPVTGLPTAAAQGELTLLVGADAADLEAARPLLAPLSAEIIHFGPVGAGSSYKLIVNLMGAVQIAATAEALVAAERAGLDLEQVVDALAKGQAASPQVVRNSRRMLAAHHDRDVLFTGNLRLKDTRYGVRLARQLDVDARLGRAALQAYQHLVELGFGEQNETKLIDSLRSS